MDSVIPPLNDRGKNLVCRAEGEQQKQGLVVRRAASPSARTLQGLLKLNYLATFLNLSRNIGKARKRCHHMDLRSNS